MNTKQAMKAIRALGMTCSITEHGELRVDYPVGSPLRNNDSAYFTADADDAVATATHMAARIEAPGKDVQDWLTAFRAHLASGKFQGTELICAGCMQVCTANKYGVSQCCEGSETHQERKDWISTADVLRWLDDLAGRLL
jgi:hypothetical protein